MKTASVQSFSFESRSTRLLLKRSVTRGLNGIKNGALQRNSFSARIDTHLFSSPLYRNFAFNKSPISAPVALDATLPNIGAISTLVYGLNETIVSKNSQPQSGVWVEIPSYSHDSKNFLENVELLKELSHGNWKTKSYNADVNLHRGDFHIYMVNNEPKVGIRFLDECIYEIAGVNGAIPVKYFDEIKQHIEGVSLNGLVLKELMECKKQKSEAETIKNDISAFVKDDNLPEILNRIGMPYELLSKGNVAILSDFGAPSRYYDWEDIGVNVNKIFEKVVRVCGNVNISDSQLQSFGQLAKIEGDLDLVGSSIKTLGGELKEVGGSLHLQNSGLEDLGALEKVGKIARFSGSDIKTLGNLRFVGKDLILLNSKIRDLGNLEHVGGSLYCESGAYDEQDLLEKGIYVRNGVISSGLEY